MVPFVEQARMYKLYPTTAGFKAVIIEDSDKVHAKFQSFVKITYVTSSCNILLLFPLL